MLEELEGLGILAHDRTTGTYQLSSPIIASMIGSDVEVSDRLSAFADEPPPREVEPSKRRARLKAVAAGHRKGLWLDPLTPAQISKITRAIEPGATQARPTVIFGSPGMLIDHIKSAIDPDRYDEHHGTRITVIDQAANAASLTRQLDAKGRRCYLISPDLRWDGSWIESAVTAARERSLAIALIGNLDHAWRVIVEDPRGPMQLAKARIETLAPLGPLELDDQLQRAKFSLSEIERAALLNETGSFLEAVGYWTDRQLVPKKELASGQSTTPRLGPLPERARVLLMRLVDFLEPDNTFDVEVVSDCCNGEDPARVFDWLMLTGLAEPLFRERRNLTLNRAFWSPGVRELLSREG